MGRRRGRRARRRPAPRPRWTPAARAEALRIAQEALAIVERPFLPDVLLAVGRASGAPELRDLEGPLLEVAGRAAFALGPAHRGEAERLARRLVEREPYRESGHGLLMEVLADQGNIVEALRVFDGLRVRLLDELGVTARRDLTALHEQLLRQEHGDARARAPPGRRARRRAAAARRRSPPLAGARGVRRPRRAARRAARRVGARAARAPSSSRSSPASRASARRG